MVARQIRLFSTICAALVASSACLIDPKDYPVAASSGRAGSAQAGAAGVPGSGGSGGISGSASAGVDSGTLGGSENGGAAGSAGESPAPWQRATKLFSPSPREGAQFGYRVAVGMGVAAVSEYGSLGGIVHIYELIANEWVGPTSLDISDGGCQCSFAAEVDVVDQSVFVASSRPPTNVYTKVSEVWTVTSAIGFDFWADGIARYPRSVAAGPNSVLIGVSRSTGDTSIVACDAAGNEWNFLDEIEPADTDPWFGRVTSSGDLAASSGTNRVFPISRGAQGWASETPIDSPEPDIDFGAHVALDGQNLIASASEAGSAFAYRRSGTTWVLEEKLTPADVEPSAGFSTSIAVAGTWLAVGAPVAGAGSVYLYERDTSGWLFRQRIDGEKADEQFGFAIDIKDDWLIVGARNGGPPSMQGAVYLFQRRAN